MYGLSTCPIGIGSLPQTHIVHMANAFSHTSVHEYYGEQLRQPLVRLHSSDLKGVLDMAVPYYFHQISLAIILLMMIPACASTSSSRETNQLDVGAWVTYWDFKRGMQSVNNSKGVYQDVFFFSTHFNQQGRLELIDPTKNDYRSAIHQASLGGTRTWMTIVNDVVPLDAAIKPILKDPEIIHAMLQSPQIQTQHIQDMIRMAQDLGVTGIDLDYENLFPEDRQDFSTFLARLAQELRAQNLALAITVQPKTREKFSQGAGAMDWTAICRSTDRLQIMLYNLHSQHTKPGPMATPEWIQEVMNYAKTQCPRDKVVPILKVSGMLWSKGGVEGVQYDTAMELKSRHNALDRRNPINLVPFFSYDGSSETGMVYYEDARSLSLKIHTLQTMGFDKLVLWSLGREDPALTPTLQELLSGSPSTLAPVKTGIPGSPER